MRIDVVSDIACPWCAIGVNALERALEQLGDSADIEVHFQPFELNPDMPPEGVGLTDYLISRVGMSPDQVEASHVTLRERGNAVGFSFGERSMIWNTFDAHRLLYWADVEGPAGAQRRLKLALLQAYHGEGRNPGAEDVLLECVAKAGLDEARAREVLEQELFTQAVRDAEDNWMQKGVRAVPTMIINQTQALQGVQPVAMLENLLRTELAAQG
ncbi:DsbA family oxidoreductase [Saccharospirillum alexandrii]|uniref:DsbA family oxidoreductase n=1 Tax=Saccharospirillum alexandrii TaxID=2448477 RepID=UPI000FD87812|nr:DsbA family oxidoreductase [Saccharospirillum alexandrii]